MTTMTDSETWQTPPDLRAQVLELYGLTCPPMWGPPRRPEFPTLGPKACLVLRRLGYEPMPWQRYVYDVALEIDPATGLFAYRDVGLSISRQQAKTTEILGAMVHRIAAWPRQRVVYAAQTRGMARTRWEDEFLETLDASDLHGHYRTRKSNGNEAIIWSRTRSLLGITANTEKAGHGPPLDMGVIDEAFAHEDDRLEQAFSPAMVTKAMAQLWWASAGGTDKSVWLNRKRAQGRALIERLWETGQHPRTAYFEWYAPEHMARDDPATWRSCLPALGYTVTEDTIRAELEKLEPAEFDRAYLNRTRKAAPPLDPNVPRGKWPGLVDASSRPGAERAFAIDVSHARDSTTIAAASLRADGKVHLEVVARRPGTDWVVPVMVKLRELWGPVAVAVAGSGSPAASLIPDLVAAGIDVPADKDRPDRGHLVVLRTGDQTEACGQMADAMNQSTAVHLDQVALTAAVNGARTRRVGDAWTLDRTSSQVDIAPLCAATWARWALLTRLALIQEDYDVGDSVF